MAMEGLRSRERHVGIERMSMLRGYKEAVVGTGASPTIPETTTMVGTVAVGEGHLELIV